ncbi:hypothetical protein DV20_30210 [Amycolatopsis rifamycinica]|uniref:Uncharacterized protein n=1 Tax=Amycolatopsis rifamycinica TaxID=287986 RepID=A0A066TTD8_9PSEU|nr:hypothetical protein DV20_30210 [Amycolatopsis rifamycinica]
MADGRVTARPVFPGARSVVLENFSAAAACWPVQNVLRPPFAGFAYQPASRSDTSLTRKSAFYAPSSA